MKRKNAILIGIVSLMGIGLLFTQCSKDKEMIPQEPSQQDSYMVPEQPNPGPGEVKIPEATVELKEYEKRPYFKNGPTSWLTPEELTATLAAGESIDEIKEGYIEGAPPLGDVMFCLDLTGSMGGELNNAKANSINIMNAVSAIIDDTYFGVMSHMDYDGTFGGCGYADIEYGNSDDGDYPYFLDQSMTDNIVDVENVIDGLSLGIGGDYPENYSRPFYESYSDSDIGWRTGSKKILIAWLDAVPHDCNPFAILDLNYSYGPDPGRDGIVGTSDDLEILEVLNGMKDNNITLIVLNSYASNNELWTKYAEITGGTSVIINSDGTVPGGVDIADLIANLILSEVSSIDEITLDVCTPGYESWLTYIEPFDPSMYMFDPLAPVPWNEFADITITVPDGTEDGDYTFDICLIGDGAVYGQQTVNITVQSVIEIPFDVHPTSCPNPINRNGGGVIPMAILGTEDFDVTQIDPSTLQIMGVSPLMWAYEDVATPYHPFIGKALDRMSCNTNEGDGFMDLTIKFDKQEIVALLTGYNKNDVVVLTITGMLMDGTDIVGEDIIWIVK